MTQSRSLTAGQEMRLFAGLVVQPLASAILGFITFPLIDISGRALNGGVTTDPMRAAISVGLGAGFASFFVTLCGAAPVVVWLLKRGPLRLRQILLGGAMIGNLPFALIVPLGMLTGSGDATTSFGVMAILRALTAGAVFGMVGAALFWAISIRGTAMEMRWTHEAGQPSSR